VIAERDLGRDVRREVTHLPQIAFDRAFERKAGNTAIGILDLGRAVPLDREVFGWNLVDDGGDLSARRGFISRSDLYIQV
jgi:hypothetical protein